MNNQLIGNIIVHTLLYIANCELFSIHDDVMYEIISIQKNCCMEYILYLNIFKYVFDNWCATPQFQFQ